MILSQCIARVRDVLDDPNGSKWDDAQVTRHIDEQMRVLFRAQVQAQKEYHNFTLHLYDTNAYSVVLNVFEYRVPSWVTHIARVYLRTSDSNLSGNLSPYLQTGTTSPVILNNEITKAYFGDRPRWTWEGNHTFRLWGFVQPQKLTVTCAKLPPRMFKGLIDSSHVNAQKMYFPTPSILGEQDLEEGALINCDVQVTGVANPASTNLGAIRRVVYSTPNAQVGGLNRTELTFDSSFAPTLGVGDAVETIIPLPDQHMRYLVLKVAVACLQKKLNMPAIQALADELRAEQASFTDYAATPRDRQGPYFKRSSTLQQAPLDPNKRRVGYVYY